MRETYMARAGLKEKARARLLFKSTTHALKRTFLVNSARRADVQRSGEYQTVDLLQTTKKAHAHEQKDIVSCARYTSDAPLTDLSCLL